MLHKFRILPGKTATGEQTTRSDQNYLKSLTTLMQTCLLGRKQNISFLFPSFLAR